MAIIRLPTLTHEQFRERLIEQAQEDFVNDLLTVDELDEHIGAYLAGLINVPSVKAYDIWDQNVYAELPRPITTSPGKTQSV